MIQLQHCNNNSFVFIQTISIAPLQAHNTTQRRSRHNTDTVSDFHAEAPQATGSEGLAQGPYTWRLVRDSNPRPLERKASNLPISHRALSCIMIIDRTVYLTLDWHTTT